MRDDGFSLIETTIAAGLLAGGISALLQLLVVAAHANLQAEQVTRASMLAAQKVEALRARAWGAAVDGADTVGEYRRHWTVRAWSEQPAGALLVTVDVDPGGAHLVTLRARTVP